MKLYLLVAVTLVSLAPAVRGGEQRVLEMLVDVKKAINNCYMKCSKGDWVTIHYTGTLEDGTVFDSTTMEQPFTFKLGAGKVIRALDEGLAGMCEGEIRELVIPPELAYGNKGLPPKIPGGATLIYEVELLSREQRSDL